MTLENLYKNNPLYTLAAYCDVTPHTFVRMRLKILWVDANICLSKFSSHDYLLRKGDFARKIAFALLLIVSRRVVKRRKKKSCECFKLELTTNLAAD